MECVDKIQLTQNKYSGMLLWKRGIYWQGEQQSASQGLCSMELINILLFRI
jgi:hypothetical protein